jgi:hypothetical protein
VRPALSIGQSEGDSAYLFSRVTDVAVDGRGRILVLDQQTRDVRAFDPAGAFLYRMGRAGQGPGELGPFANAVLVGAADTVFVPDYAQRRINVFDPAGVFVRDLPIQPTPGGRSWELLADGRFLFRGLTIGRDSANRFYTWDALFTAAPPDPHLDTLVVFDYPRSPLGAPGAPQVPLIINAVIWTRLADGRIAWSSLDRSQILVHAPTGEVQSVVRHSAWRPRPVTQADKAALRAMMRTKLTLLGGDASALDRLEVIEPEFLPAFTALRAGPGGTLWVQLTRDVASIDPMALNAQDRTAWLGGPTWHVLDAEGRFLGEVTLPPRTAVLRIKENAIYGVQKDEQDVEHVVRLDLEKPRAAGS